MKNRILGCGFFVTFASMNTIDILENAGIRATPNRILILRTLMESTSPLSMNDLERILDPMEKSSIFRVLAILLDHHLVHGMEDGRGIAMYEFCNSEHDGEDNDMHAHFYCEKCRKVYCLESVPTPVPPMPEGFEIHSINYMLKGVCAACSRSTVPKR